MVRAREGKHSPFKAANAILGAEITIGAETGSRTISIQLIGQGGDLAQRASIMAYLSDDANGDSIAVTAPDTVAAGTDGIYMPIIAGKLFNLISEADGDIDLVITENGVDTWYLVLIMPDGSLEVSDAIDFAL